MRFYVFLSSLLFVQWAAGEFHLLSEKSQKKKDPNKKVSTDEPPSITKLDSQLSVHVSDPNSTRKFNRINRDSYFESSPECLAKKSISDPAYSVDDKLPTMWDSPYPLWGEDRTNDTIASGVVGDTNSLRESANSEAKLGMSNGNQIYSDESEGTQELFNINQDKDKDDSAKDLFNLLRGNGPSKKISTGIQGGALRNENTFPVNDDIADFASYMKSRSKNLSQKGKWERKETTLPGYCNSGGEVNKQASIINSQPFGTGRSSYDIFENRSSFKRSEKKDCVSTDMLSDEGESWTWPGQSQIKKKFNKKLKNVNESGAFQKNYFLSSKDLPSKKGVYFSSGPTSLDDEIEDEIIQAAKKSKEDGTTIGIVKDRVIVLPEPLAFNSTHIVSSFLYSMIPFKSPLLTLLDQDKHSKYIMIKVDPVIEVSNRINNANRNQVDSMEKNIIELIDTSINSIDRGRFPDDNPRSCISRLKNKTYRSRNIRNDSSSQCKSFTGVVS